MGQVVKRPDRDGWWIVWTDGCGRRRRRKAPGGKREARGLLAALEREAFERRHDIEAPATNDVEIEGLLDAWTAYLVERRRANTVASYTAAVRHVLDWLRARGRRIELVSDLRLADVERCAREHLAGVSAATINLRVGNLRRLLRWSRQRGMIRSNPLADWQPLAQGPRRERIALTEYEIGVLLRASPPELAEVWTVFLGSGLRCGELCALEWQDVDLAAGFLRVRGEIAKNHRERRIPLRADVAAILARRRMARPRRIQRAARWLKEAEAAFSDAEDGEPRAKAEARVARARLAVEAARERVFLNSKGMPWADMLSRHLKRIARAAGLPAALSPHILRHTFGSHLIRAGASVKAVQALLGHSKASTTMDCYAHSFEEDHRATVERLPIVTDLAEQMPCAPHAPSDRKRRRALA